MGTEKIYLFDDLEVGQEFPSAEIKVTPETVAKYTEAVQDETPFYRDPAAAQQAGFEGIVAPPTMAAVYMLGALNQVKRPPGGIHARQEFTFLKPVKIGETLKTKARVEDKFLRKERKYVVLAMVTTNEKDEEVVKSKMTVIWAK